MQLAKLMTTSSDLAVTDWRHAQRIEYLNLKQLFVYCRRRQIDLAENLVLHLFEDHHETTVLTLLNAT